MALQPSKEPKHSDKLQGVYWLASSRFCVPLAFLLGYRNG